VSETVADSGNVTDSDEEEVELCVGHIVDEALGEMASSTTLLERMYVWPSKSPAPCAI